MSKDKRLEKTTAYYVNESDNLIKDFTNILLAKEKEILNKYKKLKEKKNHKDSEIKELNEYNSFILFKKESLDKQYFALLNLIKYLISLNNVDLNEINEINNIINNIVLKINEYKNL